MNFTMSYKSNKSKGKTSANNAANEAKAIELFDSYAEEDEPDVMGMDGICRYVIDGTLYFSSEM